MSVDRGFTWLDDETVALIEIWGNEDIQHDLKTAKRNFTVYERIASELNDVGFRRTAYQCREKIKRLRKEYQVARYCVQYNISQKKPMKYYDQVDKVFSREDPDGEDSALSSLKFEDSSDFPGNQAVILSGPDADGSLKMRVRMRSEERQNDSNDTLIDESHLSDPPTLEAASDSENNVLAEEFEDESNTVDNSPINEATNDHEEVDEETGAQSPSSNEPDHPSSVEDNEPPIKKHKHHHPKLSWFQSVMDNVTDKFLDYQQHVDAKFLERIVSLEKERIKRDETIQKLWMDFEEKRRKEEQQHELKMMSLFGQFVNQILCPDESESS